MDFFPHAHIEFAKQNKVPAQAYVCIKYRKRRIKKCLWGEEQEQRSDGTKVKDKGSTQTMSTWWRISLPPFRNLSVLHQRLDFVQQTPRFGYFFGVGAYKNWSSFGMYISDSVTFEGQSAVFGPPPRPHRILGVNLTREPTYARQAQDASCKLHKKSAIPLPGPAMTKPRPPPANSKIVIFCFPRKLEAGRPKNEIPEILIDQEVEAASMPSAEA